MSWAKAKTWLLVVLLLVAAALAAQFMLAPWLSERFWNGRPKYPQAPRERMFLSNWRGMDREDSAPLRSVPFQVTVKNPLADVDGIVVENTSSQVVRNVWFHRQDMPNFYNASTIVESVTADKKTETEKVLALWALFPKYYYNYYPLHCSGLLVDPPTLLAVLGTAQCNFAASVLETLCQLAGCETRLIGVELNDAEGNIAHCVLEVKADGRWIYMDPDGHAIYKRPDGDWASAQDLMQSPEIVRNASHAYYKPSVLAEAFARGSVLYLNEVIEPFELAQRQVEPSRYSAYHHAMRFDMLPGARTELFPQRKGRFFSMDLPLYCNGTLRWAYRAADFSEGLCPGTIGEDLDARLEGNDLLLRPHRTGRQASLIIPMGSPYLMVGGRFTGQIDTSGHVRVYVLPFVKTAISPLEGWVHVGSISGTGTITFDDLFQKSPVFGYALKLDIPDSGATVRSLEVQTWLQGSPRALPYLTPGENPFILCSENGARPVAVTETPEGESVLFDNGLRLAFSLAKTATPRGNAGAGGSAIAHCIGPGPAQRFP